MRTGRIVAPRWRDPEDDAGIEAVLSVIEEYISLDENVRLAAADVIRWEYIQGRLDERELPKPISLAATKEQLDKLAKTAAAFSEALKAVHDNPNVAGQFHSIGVNFHELSIASELPLLAKAIKKELPSGQKARWREIKPARDLFLELAHIYSLATGKNAKSGITHDGTHDKYHGPLCDLYKAVRTELNAQAGKEVYPSVNGKTLLKYLGECE